MITAEWRMNAEDSGEAVAIIQKGQGAFDVRPLSHDVRQKGTAMVVGIASRGS